MQEIKDLSAYRQALKVKILETATKAFLSRGIKAVKMDDIASALSISKRTVYEIYGDKESLLFECIKDGHEKRHREMTEFAEQHNVMETVLEAYRRKVEEFSTVNHAFYEDVQLYPQVMDYVEEKRQSSHQYFISFMQRGVKEGYFREGVNFELISKMFEAIGRSIGQASLYTQYPYEELLTNMMLIPMRGLCTSKGIKILDGVMKA